jgi:hypothetical protein
MRACQRTSVGAEKALANRNGEELVSAVIREAGPKAVESFSCVFFARVQSKHTDSVYRTAAHHFFRWCGDCGLQLDALKASHVAGFFEAKQAEWRGSTERIYFGALGAWEAARCGQKSEFLATASAGRFSFPHKEIG